MACPENSFEVLMQHRRIGLDLLKKFAKKKPGNFMSLKTEYFKVSRGRCGISIYWHTSFEIMHLCMHSLNVDINNPR